jgi:hypothetical protein
MEYVVAWVIVAVAGLGTLAGIFVLTRSVGNAWRRALLRCLAAVLLLVPWQIQVVEGKYAPAFIVAVFEGLFRTGGNPRPALMVLGMASLLVVAVFLIVAVTRRMRGTPEA